MARLPLIFACLSLVLAQCAGDTNSLSNGRRVDSNSGASNNAVSKSGSSQDTLAIAQKVASSGSFNESEVKGYGDLTNDLETWEGPLDLQKAFPYYLSGYDDEDRPIWISEIGKYNLRKIVEAGGDNFALLDKYASQCAFRILKSINARSTPERPIHEAMFIADFDQLEIFQFASLPTVAYAIKLARIYRDLIVNHIGASIVINANFLAENLLNIWRPIIGRAAEKIEIYGSNKQRWLPVLRRYFPEDTLPEWYGGSKNFQPLAVYG